MATSISSSRNMSVLRRISMMRSRCAGWSSSVYTNAGGRVDSSGFELAAAPRARDAAGRLARSDDEWSLRFLGVGLGRVVRGGRALGIRECRAFARESRQTLHERPPVGLRYA